MPGARPEPLAGGGPAGLYRVSMAETLDSATARRLALGAAAGFPPRYGPNLDGAAEFVRLLHQSGSA